MPFAFLRLLLVMMVISGSVVLANFPQQPDPSYELWLIRSQTITADLIKDASGLDAWRRPLLLAKLAQRWWQENPKQARSWMVQAIETVEVIPNKENPGDRRARLGAAVLLLKIVASLDQQLSKRLVTVLTSHNEAEPQSAEMADGLFEVASALIDQDPQRAAELGTIALQNGPPSNLAPFLIKLSRKDRSVGNAFFRKVLIVARQTLAPELLGSLVYVAFPVETEGGSDIPVPPDVARTELLQIDVAFLQANQINAENKNSVCAAIGAVIAPVLTQFDRLLPQQASTARQAISQCQSQSPLAQQRMDDTLRRESLETVDDLLKAAGEATDNKVRTVYEFRAAGRAMDKKDYDRAIKILDSMNKESREFSDGTWYSRRWEFAYISALDKYNRGDLNGMRLTLNAVPEDLQSFAKLAFVYRLPEKRNPDTDPTLEFLNDARAGLSRSYGSDGEKYSWYFALLGMAVKYKPDEATAVLKEAIAALNRAVKEKEKTTLKDQSGNLDTSPLDESVPATLLEIDEYAVKEALSSIISPETRAQVRLALLEACLDRMRKAKPSSPKATRVASKGA